MTTGRQQDPHADKYLLFIDTNIWLDLYRLATNEDLEVTLRTIGHAHDRIICTSQVQMELMKNRQKTIIEMLKAFNAASGPKLPPIVTADAAGQALKMASAEMEKHRKRAAERISEILVDPHAHDVVYKAMEAIMTNPTDLVMGRQLATRNQIRSLARKRWILGYPPRKPSDTSIGDAVNWEWVVNCAVRREGHVIIVSRDSDYGPTFGGESYLNDWLQQEYHSRLAEVGKTGTIVLETHLAAALRRMAIAVPDAVADAEERLIKAEASILSGTASAQAGASGTLL